MDNVLPSFGSEPVLEPLLQEILKGTWIELEQIILAFRPCIVEQQFLAQVL